MPHLLSPLHVGHMQLANRIALAGLSSGCADANGFVTPSLTHYYVRRAHGGVALIFLEPAMIAPPDQLVPHLGLYHDSQISALASLVDQIHAIGSHVILPLECAVPEAQAAGERLDLLYDLFSQAGWRALAAGCDGVMLSAADGGLLHALLSPLRNRRADQYGGTLEGRLRFLVQMVERLRGWFGKRLVIAFRLHADELTAGGMTIQDTQVIARRLASVGVDLFDITLHDHAATPIARFPGWRVPLAAAIKRVLLGVPVVTSGSLGDPLLADSVIREGSADLVMLGHSLRVDPDWPQRARIALQRSGDSAREWASAF